MESLGRYALTIGATIAILTGCAGSQQPLRSADVMPLSPAAARHKTSSSDLLYASGGCGGTCVFSYPDGALVGTLDKPRSEISGDCSDAAGDVFITDNDAVLEYAHGGSAPIATLRLPGTDGEGCSIDPTTGNLAVVFRGSGVDVAIFPGATGTPTLYGSQVDSRYCGYDGSGNLSVNGYAAGGGHPGFSELPKGGSAFSVLSISDSVGVPGQVQWDGKYITYQSQGHNDSILSQLKISGSRVTIVRTIHFDGIKSVARPSWIHGSKIFVPYSDHQDRAKLLAVWNYPRAGKMTKKIKDFGDYEKTLDFQGVTLSVAPRR